MTDPWFINEIAELAKHEEEIDSHTALALHLNACFENLRRQGKDYNQMKEELLAHGKLAQQKMREYHEWDIARLREKGSKGNGTK